MKQKKLKLILKVMRILILALLFIIYILNNKTIAQDNLSLHFGMNNPLELHDKKQEILRNKLGVFKSLTIRIINRERDTLYYSDFNDNGQLISNYYTETKQKQIDRANKLREENKLNWAGGNEYSDEWATALKNSPVKDWHSKDTQIYEGRELITKDYTGKIKRRLRNTFLEEDLVFIHEVIDEETQTPTFRTVMKLNNNHDVISSTCFDGARNTTFSTIYSYDGLGNRVKKIKYSDKILEPEIELFEYYDNGLLKKETKGVIITEYEYYFKK